MSLTEALMEWEEVLTSIALLWHQPREYVLEQEMIRVWEVVRIQYKKNHPDEDTTPEKEILEEIDESQKATFKAQERARKRREQQDKEKENGD